MVNFSACQASRAHGQAHSLSVASLAGVLTSALPDLSMGTPYLNLMYLFICAGQLARPSLELELDA
jgi:hypothetical protein